MKNNINVTVFFLCAALGSASLVAAVTSASLVEGLSPAYESNELLLVVSAAGFFTACVLVWLRPDIAYRLGVASGVLAFYWFRQLEFGYLFPAMNSWIVFNLPDDHHFTQDILVAKLKIVFFITVLAATGISTIRLLPPVWLFRKRPIRNRTWPAIAVCFAAMLGWYGVSVSPYRIPLLVDHMWPQVVILHVGKSGTQFHETSVSLFKDGRVFLSRNDRRLFHYRFELRGGSAVLDNGSTSTTAALRMARELAHLNTGYPVPLRSREAEGWYVLLNGHSAFAFTRETRTQPPTEVVALFRELESTVHAEKTLEIAKDVCLGFCYDPLAGLGVEYMNDRCRDRNGTHCI
jgi:hypothetical protein